MADPADPATPDTSTADADAPPPKAPPAAPEGPSTLTRFRKGLVRGVGIAAIVLFTAFALANRQFVEFGWLFGSTEIQEVSGDRVAGGVPLIMLLMAAFVLGAIVGAAFVSLRSRSRRRSRVSED